MVNLPNESRDVLLRWVKPDTGAAILENSRFAGKVLAARIDEWEAMPSANLRPYGGGLLKLQGALTPKFKFGAHEEMPQPRDPFFLAGLDEGVLLMEQIEAVMTEAYDSVPNGRARLCELLARIADHDLESKFLKRRAATGGVAKRDNDLAANQAKQAVIGLWPEVNRKGWTAVRLYTELGDRGHKIAPDTVRKWLTKLRKTGTC